MDSGAGLAAARMSGRHGRLLAFAAIASVAGLAAGTAVHAAPPVPPDPPADVSVQCEGDVPDPVDLTAVDPEAGTITIDHEPIDALSWPRMTMRFSAEPSILKDLTGGNTVRFEIKSSDESQMITSIRAE